jgi:thiamine pyrophosphokinase
MPPTCEPDPGNAGVGKAMAAFANRRRPEGRRFFMAVLIFANGEIADPDWIKPYLEEATTVIAANGGLRHLLTLGRRPDVVIGDLDSLPPDARLFLVNGGTKFVSRPADKDETDLELALLYAIERFSEPIFLLGALGGRLDQSIGNILLLAHPRWRERPIRLVEQRECAWLVTAETTIEGTAGDLVSLIPLGGDVEVVATNGLRWPLQNETLHFGRGRGISNQLTAAVATVRVQRGLLLCVHSRQS